MRIKKGKVVDIKKNRFKNSFRFFRPIAFLATAFFLLNVSILTAQGRDPKGSNIKIFSRVLNEERTLSISLPEDYESFQKYYSVLYVLDAEGDRTIPQSISTVEELYKKGIAPQMIVVGIWNTNRNRDMIPEAVSHRPGSGGSDKFLVFISEELVPFIKKSYRTEDFSILYGMSNSALFSVYALLETPETFNSYIASSPMIGHCPEYMKSKMENFVNQTAVSNRVLYMIYGSDDSPRVTDYVPDFHDYLKSNGSRNFVNELVILEGEGHVPQSSLTRALKFIFETKKLPI
ncbi:MAG: alpha/beta hydrolase-fold protein [Candidatus Aminicenantes bacterium]|nr:alpha/beta hydrolase-fold protein [Candidatus Aminicenantes bacterium]